MTIIVDELDRCRPDFALGLLERMKHLFDVEGVAFVLLVNRDQIESYIRAVYGHRVDARAYLLKFGTIFIDLPNKQANDFYYVKGNEDYCSSLLHHYGFSEKVKESRFLPCVSIFASHFDLTLREIERVFAIMAIYYGSLSRSYFTDELLIALLSVLKVKRPSIYNALSTGAISAGEFYQQSALDIMKIKNVQNLNFRWAKDMLDCCMMSDSEFKDATQSGDVVNQSRSGLVQMVDSLRMDRKTIIPTLCSHLDRFSLQIP